MNICYFGAWNLQLGQWCSWGTLQYSLPEIKLLWDHLKTDNSPTINLQIIWKNYLKNNSETNNCPTINLLNIKNLKKNKLNNNSKTDSSPTINHQIIKKQMRKIIQRLTIDQQATVSIKYFIFFLKNHLETDQQSTFLASSPAKCIKQRMAVVPALQQFLFSFRDFF